MQRVSHGNSFPRACPSRGVFTTTHWSVVLRARDDEDARAHVALETLCRTYWRPIYTYLRRIGYDTHQAQDLTQGFFAHFLEHGFLRRLRHQEGRFRSFLLTFLKRFLSDERDKARTQKRGGGVEILSWEECSLEERRLPFLNGMTAAHAYDRRWATTLLERAKETLRVEYKARGREALYRGLHSFLTGEAPGLSYAEVAANLAMPENSVKSAIYRLRRRYGELIREEIAQTVETPPLIEEEINYLLAIFSE